MCKEGRRPRGAHREPRLPSTPPAAWSCPLPTLPGDPRGLLECHGLVACFLLMFNIFFPQDPPAAPFRQALVREKRGSMGLNTSP